MSKEKAEALYKSLKVTGRRDNCPRLGIYKITETYTDDCYNKPALMAKCNWKQKIADQYYFEGVIQLESFKNNASQEQLKLLNEENLAGKELEVDAAEYDTSIKVFSLKWHFIEKQQNRLDIINLRLKNGELDESEPENDELQNLDLENLDTVDYSVDDDIDHDPII